jgi:hypothetical protein
MKQRSGFSLFLFLIIGLVMAPALKVGFTVPVIISVSLIALTFIGLYLTTFYTITDDAKMLVQCAFLINEQIDIASIKKITNTRTLMAAPALSFDRMHISYGTDNGIVISPKDKKAFINALKSLNNNIVVEGY